MRRLEIYASVSPRWCGSFARILTSGSTSWNLGVVWRDLRRGQTTNRLTCEPAMRAAVEISRYPLTGDSRPLIQAFIDRLNLYPEVHVLTNALSTQIW